MSAPTRPPPRRTTAPYVSGRCLRGEDRGAEWLRPRPLPRELTCRSPQPRTSMEPTVAASAAVCFVMCSDLPEEPPLDASLTPPLPPKDSTARPSSRTAVYPGRCGDLLRLCLAWIPSAWPLGALAVIMLATIEARVRRPRGLLALPVLRALKAPLLLVRASAAMPWLPAMAPLVRGSSSVCSTSPPRLAWGGANPKC